MGILETWSGYRKESQKELQDMFDVLVKYMYEKHTNRGLEKMKMFLTVIFIIRLTSAKAKMESRTISGLAKVAPAWKTSVISCVNYGTAKFIRLNPS